MKSISITAETQTEEGDVLSLCFINPSSISLEVSDIARKMFEINKDLFQKINKSTDIKFIYVDRLECRNHVKKANSTYTDFRNSTKKNQKNIAFFPASGEELKKVTRIKTKFGKHVDIEKERISYSEDSPMLDLNNITLDDLKNSTDVCSVEEISIFSDINIRSFLIHDFLSSDDSLYEVGYKVKIAFEHQFENYFNSVINALKRSIVFLKNYQTSATFVSNYDYVTNSFSDNFSRTIFKQLAIDVDTFDRINLSDKNVVGSELGIAAMIFYNAKYLIDSSANKSIYGRIMRNLLPTKKTSPDLISRTVQSFESLLQRCMSMYNLESSKLGNPIETKMYNNIKSPNVISVETMETFEIDRSSLGYFIFSNEQKGLNVFSSEMYKTRYILEQIRYYPEIKVNQESNFMTNGERSAFMNLSNKTSFLTPVGIGVRDQKITLDRGPANLDLEALREFRLMKSGKYLNDKMGNIINEKSTQKIGNSTLAGFNLEVGKPRESILGRSTEQNMDHLIESKYYLGDTSAFLNSNLEVISENHRELKMKDDLKVLSILSDIIPKSFIEQKNKIDSIYNIQLSNQNSIVRSAIMSNEIDIESIPPQIKSMMVQDFVQNPNVDPLANFESSQALSETQMNIYEVRLIRTFSLGENGFHNVSDRIYESVSDGDLSGRSNILAKSFNYEVSELGIVKDLAKGTIYNNLILIRG